MLLPFFPYLDPPPAAASVKSVASERMSVNSSRDEVPWRELAGFKKRFSLDVVDSEFTAYQEL